MAKGKKKSKEQIVEGLKSTIESELSVLDVDEQVEAYEDLSDWASTKQEEVADEPDDEEEEDDEDE